MNALILTKRHSLAVAIQKPPTTNIYGEYKMNKIFNEYKCYEYKVNKHYYVLVIVKEDCAEFMLCKLDSNVRYWVCTDYLGGINSVDEYIKTMIKRYSQQWIRMWKIRCNNGILSYDK